MYLVGFWDGIGYFLLVRWVRWYWNFSVVGVMIVLCFVLLVLVFFVVVIVDRLMAAVFWIDSFFIIDGCVNDLVWIGVL